MSQQITVHQALQAASAFRAGGKRDSAEAMCRQILAAQPEHANTLHLLGVIAAEAGRYEESIALISKALKTSLTPEICLSDIGTTYLRTHQFEEAAEFFRRALSLRPEAATYNNLADALWRLGRIEEAIQHCRKAIELNPHHSGAHANLALLLLLCGDYENGLPEHEWRIHYGTVSDSPLPQWNGEISIGKTILVRTEQGIGDAIHFMRYLPLLRARSGAKIVVECNPALSRLFRSFETDGVEFTDAKYVACFDYQIPLLSLPLALRQFAPLTARPYLSAERRLQNLRPEGSLHVGLAWAGNPNHSRDRMRSIDPAHLTPLLAMSGVCFYSLQVGQAAPEGVTDLTSGITDFADTAALIAGLDLVISVDTAVAHLAGALGKPVWTLLPFVPDWRWGLEREDTPWYPTMRLFRQKRAGDWAEVLERVVECLRETAAIPL